MIDFIPQTFENPPRCQTEKDSAWKANAPIVKDIVNRFVKNPNVLLEFGVEYGYSTSIFSSYFNKVIGVDTFSGDINSGIDREYFEETKYLLRDYTNVELIRSSYQDFIIGNNTIYDAIHVDIIHTYEDTYACGKWAVEHSDVVMFHDTMSFIEVMAACKDLASKYNLNFYNYSAENGLGILVRTL
jgi:hypothetical protein